MSDATAPSRQAVPLVERTDLPAELRTPELEAARVELARGLSEHALIMGDVVLSSDTEDQRPWDGDTPRGTMTAHHQRESGAHR